MPLRNMEGVHLVHFQKGDILIAQDEKIEYLYYLIEGEVHRELLTSNGAEIVLTIKAANTAETQNNFISNLIGVVILYDKYEQYSISNCSFIAHTDCRCYQIPVSSWLKYAEEHSETITKNLLSFVMDSYQVLFDMYFCKQHKNSGAQICTAILDYAITIDKKSVFGHNISNIELGKRLDIHPTTVSKILNALVEQGALKKEKGLGFVITDKELIQKIANGTVNISYRYQKQPS